jgi:outer membrane protein OmpA-like peptidoglycan-associated protein
MRSSSLILLAVLFAACTPPGATPVCAPSASVSAPALRCGGASATQPELEVDADGNPKPVAGEANPAGAKPEVEPEPEAPPPPAPKVVVNQGEVEVVDAIEFDGETARLSDTGKAVLDDVAEELKSHPEVLKVRVEGHAEPAAKAAARRKNLRLATQRATAVKAYLVSKGIAGGRLTTAGVPAPKGGDVGKTIELKITKRK